MIEEKFEDYKVYTDGNKYAFYIVGKTYLKKYDSIIEWAFSDDKLLRFADFQKDDTINDFGLAEKKSIYLSLKKFIDDCNIGSLPFDEKYNDIIEILKDEDLLYNEGKTVKVREDKIGKIGEYIFYNLLCDFFMFDCVINKLNLLTSYNMSVYGMDELFYSSKDNILIFGESKFCNSLDNGIGLINKSLSEYEDRLCDEYELVLSNNLLKDLVKIPDELKEYVNKSFTFDDFVKSASIKTIGIPVFIMHGGEEDIEYIMEKLDSINQKKIRGLNVKYILISLPINNKKEFAAYLTTKINERI